MTFELKRLGDVAEIVGGGTPSTKRSEFWDGEIPWLTPKDLSSFQGVYVEKGSRSITVDGLKASSAKLLPAGSVLYTSRAPIGYVAIAKNSMATNQGFKSLVLKDGYSPEFVYYLLRASKVEIESHASGGTFAEISAKAIADVMLPFPSFETQKSIANVLVSLDMKLENNRSISKTVEDVIQVLFKSWFIDFEPVKAKMADEVPVGMDAETAALFPSSMIESQIGPIPEGWSVLPVGDALEVAGGTTPSTKESSYWGGEFAWTTPKDLSVQEGLITTRSARTLTQAGIAKVPSGLVPVNSVLMSCRAPIGYLSINAIPTAVNQGCITLRQSGDLSPLFLLNWARANMQEVLNRAGGGTFAEISRKSFKEIPILLPSTEISKAFSAIANPFLEELKILTRENETLTAIRDSLLPRLISGQTQLREEMLVC